ncbi:MAG: KR domain-containing protein, partial [Chthoniobacterales bacterium]
QLPPAKMLAVTLPESELQAQLPSGLFIALINGPSLCVIAGPPNAVEEFAAALTARDVMHRPVQNTHAFHSRLLDPIVPAFADEVRKIRLNAPRIPFISNVTGQWMSAADATSPDYWARHLSHTARFDDALKTLWKTADPILLEAGPGRTIGILAQQHPAKPSNISSTAIASLRHSYESQPDEEVLLASAGRLWLCGMRLRWENLHGGKSCRKISLPTYPFERQIYWLDAAATAAPVPSNSGAIHKNPNPAEWFYVPSWKRTLVKSVGPGELSGRLNGKGVWLFFMDECGVNSEVVERFRTAGHEVATVRAGREFKKVGANEFIVAPGAAEDYERLLTLLTERGLRLGGIVHAWGITQNGATMSADFADAQEAGFYSLVFLAKALAKQNLGGELRLFALSNQVQDVSGAEELRPEKSTLLGPCLVIPQELPNVVTKSIDLELPRSGRLNEQAIDQLVGEICDADSEMFVAHRNAQRWVQTYEPADLPRPGAFVPIFREGGVYLITGGLGNVGREIAHHLAKNYRAKLILVGRSHLPPRESWAAWGEKHPDDPITRRIGHINDIESRGGIVLYLSASAEDQSAMHNVIEQAERQFGALHGVIHAAGVIGDAGYGEIGTSDRAFGDLHFQSKVRGLLVLESLLAGKTLDFCLLMSSLSSILGGIGQAAYSAANIYLDTFARLRSREGQIPWLSVNWDVWRTRENIWGQAGPGKTLEELGMTGDEAMQAMATALTLKRGGQLIISTGSLDARVRQWVKLESLRVGKTPSLDRSHRNSRSIGGTPVSPENEIEQFVSDTWKDVLGIDEIGVDEVFFDLGGHSLLAIQLMGRIREKYGVEVPARQLFDTPTIAGLVEFIAAKMPTAAPVVTERSLVCIQKGAPERRPFFLVAGGWGGEIEFLVYANLTRQLGGDLPLYGLKARGANAGSKPHDNVEEMAADYLAEVRAFQAHGPYLLGGECVGGIVAYEMARQLVAAGEEVALLVLLDTDRPTADMVRQYVRIMNQQKRERFWEMRVAQPTREHLENLKQLPVREQFEYIWRRTVGRAQHRRSIAADGNHAVAILQERKLVENYPKVLMQHSPGPYTGTVTLLIDEVAFEERGHLGWDEVETGGLEVHVVPGDHLSYIRAHAGVVAACLRDLIERAEPSTSLV